MATTDFFDIVTGVLQEDTIALYIFIICLDYILWILIDLMKRKWFYTKKARSRQYPAKTITDADYVDDLVFLANTPAQNCLNVSNH